MIEPFVSQLCKCKKHTYNPASAILVLLFQRKQPQCRLHLVKWCHFENSTFKPVTIPS